MFSSFAKITAAAFAVVAPLAAGFLVAHIPEVSAAVVVLVIGVGLGLSGVAVFCSLDTKEEITHLQRLNPGLRVARKG